MSSLIEVSLAFSPLINFIGITIANFCYDSRDSTELTNAVVMAAQVVGLFSSAAGVLISFSQIPYFFQCLYYISLTSQFVAILGYTIFDGNTIPRSMTQDPSTAVFGDLTADPTSVNPLLPSCPVEGSVIMTSASLNAMPLQAHWDFLLIGIVVMFILLFFNIKWRATELPKSSKCTVLFPFSLSSRATGTSSLNSTKKTQSEPQTRYRQGALSGSHGSYQPLVQNLHPLVYCDLIIHIYQSLQRTTSGMMS